MHIILSMGEYNKEIEMLCNSLFRECLQNVKLIGEQSDEVSLKQYSDKLTQRYNHRILWQI